MPPAHGPYHQPPPARTAGFPKAQRARQAERQNVHKSGQLAYHCQHVTNLRKPLDGSLFPSSVHFQCRLGSGAQPPNARRAQHHRNVHPLPRQTGCAQNRVIRQQTGFGGALNKFARSSFPPKIDSLLSINIRRRVQQILIGV